MEVSEGREPFWKTEKGSGRHNEPSNVTNNLCKIKTTSGDVSRLWITETVFGRQGGV
jgi:hypothetical protein